MILHLGIDNGVSGTIGFIYTENNEIQKTEYIPTPIIVQQDYTKKKKNISRIDSPYLHNYFGEKIENCDRVFALIERPMINPMRFTASISAARSLEATLCIVEVLNIPYQFIDSKEWQKELLPSGLKGSDQQKKASVDIGIRLFPQFKDFIIDHKDADGILIAEYARRKNL